MSEFTKKVAAEIEHAVDAVQKCRTGVQLDAFVARQHDTEPRQFRQIILEMDDAIEALEEAEINLRILDRKIKKLRNGSEEEKDEGALLMLQKRRILKAVKGKTRELEDLRNQFETIPMFTYEELEEAEREYWQERIIRQCIHSMIATGRIGVGDLDSLKQLGIPITAVIERAKPLLDEIHKSLESLAASGISALPSPATSPADAKTSLQSSTPSACGSANLVRSSGAETACCVAVRSTTAAD